MYNKSYKEVTQMTTGQLIKKARNAAGMTQSQLAEKLKIPYQSISQWERDARNPRYETLEKIADALGTSVEDMIRDPIKGLELPSDFPRLEATAEALQNWLEQIDSELKNANAKNNDEHRRTPEELQHMYNLIRAFINKKEIKVAQLKQLARLEEKRNDYQEQISKTLESLNVDAIKRVLEYAETLSKAPGYQYLPNHNGSGQAQQKVIPVVSCELLDFQYNQAQVQYQNIKNLPYDVETRAEFMAYQMGMWPDVVQYLMKGEVDTFLYEGDGESGDGDRDFEYEVEGVVRLGPPPDYTDYTNPNLPDKSLPFGS